MGSHGMIGDCNSRISSPLVLGKLRPTPFEAFHLRYLVRGAFKVSHSFPAYSRENNFISREHIDDVSMPR